MGNHEEKATSKIVRDMSEAGCLCRYVILKAHGSGRHGEIFKIQLFGKTNDPKGSLSLKIWLMDRNGQIVGLPFLEPIYEAIINSDRWQEEGLEELSKNTLRGTGFIREEGEYIYGRLHHSRADYPTLLDMMVQILINLVDILEIRDLTIESRPTEWTSVEPPTNWSDSSDRSIGKWLSLWFSQRTKT